MTLDVIRSGTETNAKKDRIMRTPLSTYFILAAAVSFFGACSNSGSETATDRAAGDSFADCDICPEMVVIPAGEFMMGSPETENRGVSRKARNTA